uniref:GTP 3',8-cyclase n=1 Tax=Candidatus Methanophagaceae archaeon ANME-1 ERB6 TaxID=2759912 RepID=A0A7G9YTX8_9EURY|nr:GTP 3',8-cyclase [Methanosarcinales archaeon ANME-1 ERB6]
MTSPTVCGFPPKLEGLSFDQQTIINYRNSDKILCMRISLSYKCNLKCKYCYTNELIDNKKEGPYKDFINIVDQGTELGLKSVVILGGEPLIYPYIFDFLEYLYDNKIIPVVFTNGILITQEIAKRLYDLNVSILVKFDGYKETQDFLSGFGTFEKIQMGLSNLISLGYNRCPENSLKLGCASVVTKINCGEIINIWEYLRNNNLFPHVEKMTITNDNAYLAASSEKLSKLFSNLREIDKREYKIQWIGPCPAIPAHNCSILFSGCYINPYLEVSVCPEIPPVKNLRKMTLRDIIQTEYFQKARNIDKYIKGKCSSCKYLIEGPCHGCRSKVLKMSGNLFDEDRECHYPEGELKGGEIQWNQ